MTYQVGAGPFEHVRSIMNMYVHKLPVEKNLFAYDKKYLDTCIYFHFIPSIEELFPIRSISLFNQLQQTTQSDLKKITKQKQTKQRINFFCDTIFLRCYSRLKCIYTNFLSFKQKSLNLPWKSCLTILLLILVALLVLIFAT